MVFPIVLVMGAAVLAAQLALSMKCKKLWIKLLPVILIGGGEICCWSVVWISEYRAMPYGAAFSASVFAAILALFLGFDVLGWCICGIVKTIQKRRK